MADSVRISELVYIDDQQLSLDDQIIINDLVSGTDAVTRITEVASLIEFITAQDLNFSGDVTFTGTLQPPPGQELDVVFNNVNIKGDMIFEPTVSVKGLYVNRHMEDVVINPATLVTNSALTWDPEQVDKNGFKGAWVNTIIKFAEPPCDGGYYVRRCDEDGHYYWEDISSLLFPDFTIITTETGIQISQENGGLIYGDPVPTNGTEGPPGPPGPPGATGPTGPAAPTPSETFYIELDPS